MKEGRSRPWLEFQSGRQDHLTSQSRSEKARFGSEWKSPGLELRDVPDTLEEGLRHGPLSSASLAGEMSSEDVTASLEVLLGGEPNEEPAEVEEVECFEGEGEDEDDSSEDEFYLTHYLRAGLTLRAGSLHKPKPHQEDEARCGTKAKSFEKMEAMDALERKSSFCKKCFGPVTGCDKLCSVSKKVLVGEDYMMARCMRRCGLGCERLANYLDRDERFHRCDAHMEPEPSPEKEEREAPAVEGLV